MIWHNWAKRESTTGTGRRLGSGTPSKVWSLARVCWSIVVILYCLTETDFFSSIIMYFFNFPDSLLHADKNEIGLKYPFYSEKP